MPTRIASGHYRIAETTSKDEEKSTEQEISYGVVRGNTANNAEHGVFGGQFGFKNSKWYAYKKTSTEVTPKLRFSPTAPTRAFKKNFTELTFAQKEFDTKSEAVHFVENEMVDEHLF